MRIESVRFYSTPLDIEHSRVIDVVGAIRQRIKPQYNLALNSYSNIDVYSLISTKSIKLNNKRAELVVRGNYFNINKYNYCVINEELYFFIENISSLNDSDENPSCIVSLLWDYWANNIDVLIDRKDDLITYISTRHINRFNNSIEQPIYFQNNDNDVNHTETEIYPDEITRFKVAYCILVVKPDMIIKTYKYDDEIEIDVSTFKFLPRVKVTKNGTQISSAIIKGINLNDNTINANVIYIPIGILDQKTNKYVKGKILTEYNNNGISHSQIYDTIISENGGDFFLNGEYTEYIQSAELVFYSPIKNTFAYQPDGTVVAAYNGVFLSDSTISGILTRDITNEDDIDYPILVSPKTVYYFVDDTLLFADINTSIEIKEKDIFTFDYLSSINIDVSNQFNKGVYTNNNFNDPKLFQLPFRYIKLYTKDSVYIISPNSKNYKQFGYEIIYYSNQPSLRIFYIDNDDNKHYINSKESYLNNSGYFSYTIDAKESYLNRNGNVLAVDKWTNTIFKPAINAISKISYTSKEGVRGFRSAFTETLTGIPAEKRYEAQMADLSNTPDSVIGSVLAEYDTISQDRVRMFLCEITDNNYLEIKKDEYYTYGYEVNTLGSPLDNYRTFFDYVKCNNCKIPLKINSEDRIEIENMFNRGVHKFHKYKDDLYTFKSDLSLSIIGFNNEEVEV